MSGIGGVKIGGVTGEQLGWPGKELAQPHLVKRGPVALAFGGAALVGDELELGPLVRDDLLRQIHSLGVEFKGLVIGHSARSQSLVMRAETWAR